MKIRLAILGVLLAILAALVVPQLEGPLAEVGGGEPEGSLVVERVWPKLTFDMPTHITTARDGTGRFFVCEQNGTIAVVDPANETKAVYLDLTKQTRRGGSEEGLLSVAFHPRFKENGKLYVAFSTGQKYYPSREAKGKADAVKTRVSCFVAKPPSAAQVDPATEKVILDGPQPWSNHNGGQLAFGPDGMLYIGLGDGGSGGDPERNGQDLASLLGKILRIDVDSGDPYSVPKDNPFVDRAGAAPEVWAYGLRNPWRFSFDRKTGALWTGDVGQDRVEIVRKVAKGTNQGWNLFEGTLPFRKGEKPQDEVVPPVAEYGRRRGASITGGFVYRGKKLTSIAGVYVCGDYVTGHVFGVRETGKSPEEVITLSGTTGKSISSFGEDEDGELYLVHHANRFGQIYTFRERAKSFR